MATYKNTTSVTTVLVDDLGAVPIDGDTVLIVQGSQTYSGQLDAIAGADLAVFTQMSGSNASLGNGNSPLQIDAALLEILGGGPSYAIAGGENGSQDRVHFSPGNPQATALFMDAACTNFEALVARVLTIQSSYDITNLYASGTVGSLILEAGGTDPTLVVLAPNTGAIMNATIERSPTTLDVGRGAKASMKDGEFPTNLILNGGEYVHRSGTITAIDGGGIIDLTQLTEDWAPTAWNVTKPTIVKAPPAKGFAWTQPTNVRAPFRVVPFGEG